uniref:Uncharacterized protein n=1 Tax=Ananas comosus var. bracteatus TaxID=296719 RepID=A0A6V7PK01_ANACO|nr:unnamed protein product [Ananas comosus var. bracteatus]
MLDAGDSIHLKGLEGDDYWLLFKRHAFRSACADDYPELQVIGRQIAKRLKGSPLGAKLPESATPPAAMLCVLRHSRITMASIMSCTDMIHELAQSVSKEECFRIESDNVRRIPSTVRHLSIDTDALLQLTSICDLKNLRTLVIFSYRHSIGSDVFKQLRSIRVLDLTRCEMEQLPKAAGELIHLRYLAFADTLKAVPSSFYRLYYLQVLDVSRSGCPLGLLKVWTS